MNNYYDNCFIDTTKLNIPTISFYKDFEDALDKISNDCDILAASFCDFVGCFIILILPSGCLSAEAIILPNNC